MKTKFFLIILLTTTFIMSCHKSDKVGSSTSKIGMVKITILYPNGDGKNFDMDYYANKHMPMVADVLGDSLKFFKIDKGIGGRTPNDKTPYLAIGYLYFDTLSEYQNSFGPNAQKITSDIPNYTNIQPVVQISEVLK